MSKRKNGWFQKLFSQCVSPQTNYLSHQVGYIIKYDLLN